MFLYLEGAWTLLYVLHVFLNLFFSWSNLLVCVICLLVHFGRIDRIQWWSINTHFLRIMKKQLLEVFYEKSSSFKSHKINWRMPESDSLSCGFWEIVNITFFIEQLRSIAAGCDNALDPYLDNKWDKKLWLVFLMGFDNFYRRVHCTKIEVFQ